MLQLSVDIGSYPKQGGFWLYGVQNVELAVETGESESPRGVIASTI